MTLFTIKPTVDDLLESYRQKLAECDGLAYVAVSASIIIDIKRHAALWIACNRFDEAWHNIDVIVTDLQSLRRFADDPQDMKRFDRAIRNAKQDQSDLAAYL